MAQVAPRRWRQDFQGIRGRAMRTRAHKPKASREAARRIILNNDPALTKDIVAGYTDSELKEWMRLLHIPTAF